MNLRRINYVLPILCLGLTVWVVVNKLSWEKNTQVTPPWLAITGNTASNLNTNPTTWSTIIAPEPVQIFDWIQTPPTTRTSLSTTIPSPSTNYTIVKQWSQPYLLIKDQLIVLDEKMQWGQRTGVEIAQNNPLIVYYRYQSTTWTTSYLYQLSKNSSRVLDNLTLVGVVQDIYVFSLKEGNKWRGISAIIDGELSTLYTWTYTTVSYLGDTIKLDNNQSIYLSLTPWS